MTAGERSGNARGRGDERWLRGLRPVAGASLGRASVLGALAAVLVVPQSWLFAHGVALVVVAGAGLGAALPWLAPIPLIILLRFVLGQASDRAALRAGAAIKGQVRADLLQQLRRLGPAWLRGRSTGEIAASVIEGVDALEPYFTRYIAHMAAVAVLPLAILAFILPRDWISGLVLLFTAPVIPLFMILIGQGTERLNQRQWQRLSRLGGRLLDGLQGLTTLKIFNATRREAEVLARVSDDYRRSTMAVLRVAFLSSLMLEFFATVGIAVVAVLIGFRLLDGSLGFEAGFFALLLAPEFYAPLRQLGADYHARMEAIGAADTIVAVLETPVPPAGTARPAMDRRISITCEDLHFAHAEGAVALQGATLQIAAGQVTALIGPSGAGKSTLLDLMLGLRTPQQGRILVGGQHLATLDPDHWLAHVAYVPARPHMFAGTVGDNIRLGQPDASAQAVRAAAALAEADGFITALPQGYDTPLGEHGHTLAGGQVQRIALARAFLKDAPVVMMDEGTASLDRATEARITAALARLARDRTVLVVAHRLATVRLADRIAVLDQGRIVEHGSHADLRHDTTRYAALLRAAGIPA